MKRVPHREDPRRKPAYAVEFKAATKVFSSPNRAEIVAVNRFSLDINAGETVCLIGTSGSGKTTVLKMINRLVEPTSGQVLINGVDIQEIDVIELRRKIGYVLQKGGLFPHMTVERNIGLLCEIAHWNVKEKKSRVNELLELVNLPPSQFADRYPRELSGGQRQRVGVARSLALDPPFILMDEPFGALDPITRNQLHAEFQQLKEKVKKTIILVTHDMTEAFKLGDRIALMDNGHLVQIGAETDFKEHPANQFVVDFLHSHHHGG